MTILAILALSTLLQFAVAVAALRTALKASRHLGWSLIIAALTMMGVHRAVALYGAGADYFGAGTPSQPGLNLHDELIALAIAAMMLAGVILIGKLVTDSRRREAALRDSEAKYRGILDNSIDTFYRTDAEGRIVMVSRSVTALLGYTCDDVIGQKLADFYTDPAGRDAFLQALQESGGRLAGYEAHLRHKDGRAIAISTSAGYLRDAEGKVIGVEGTARDIMERKRTEALTTRLGRIVEDSQNEIYVVDSETFRFLMVNRGARENLGWSMEELRSMTPFDINPELTSEQVETLLVPLQNGKKSVLEFSSVHRRADGSTYPVEIRAQISKHEDPPVLVAIIQDVTEKRRTEDALRQAQKMEAVGQLTGGIAHDFNNLLAVVVGSLDLALEKQHGNHDLTTLIERALAAAERGANLTTRLLAFSRRQALMPQVVNLRSIAEGMGELLHRTLGETIDVVFRNDEGLWNCEIDVSQLENCLLNLAINARDAMPDGGRLTISTSNAVLDEAKADEACIAPGSYVRLQVVDSGIGMSADTIARAFEPFFTTKDVGKGTGLGLSMLHGFVKQSGGHVEVQSKQGQGTTITILLPRKVQQVPAAGEQFTGTKTHGSGACVLVVEDDDDVREMVAAMLQRLGYRTAEASSGLDAVAAFKSDSSIRILITDVVLPGEMSGFDIAVRCQQHDPSLNVIFMSGYAHDKIAAQGRQIQNYDILHKPFNRSALAERLSKLEVSGTPTPAKVA